MRNLRKSRGFLPSPTLALNYILIAFIMVAMGFGSVYYFHVESAMAAVNVSAKQVSGLADSLKVDLPKSTDVDAKIVRIQDKADVIQNAAQSVTQTN